jgi:hypothetical protein
VTVASRARLRDREVIAAQITVLAEAGGQAREFERGALAALRWVVEGGAGPATGEVGDRPRTARAVVHELAAAEALIYGPASERAEFASGVEHALMWAQFVTCAPPAPTASRPRRATAAPGTSPAASS